MLGGLPSGMVSSGQRIEGCQAGHCASREGRAPGRAAGRVVELRSPAAEGFGMLPAAPCPDGRNSGGQCVKRVRRTEIRGGELPEESHCLSYGRLTRLTGWVLGDAFLGGEGRARRQPSPGGERRALPRAQELAVDRPPCSALGLHGHHANLHRPPPLTLPTAERSEPRVPVSTVGSTAVSKQQQDPVPYLPAH